MIDTAIFVPGLGCDRRLWAHQAIMLNDDTHILIADPPRQDSIKAMAAALLADAPARFAIAGLSMGGYVALEVARQAPQRVAGLALLDTNAHGDMAESSARRQDLIDRAAQGDYAGVIEASLPLLVAHDFLNVPAVADVYRAMALEMGAETFINQQRAIISRPDNTAFLSSIAVPTLVLCGEHDALSPPAIHRDMAAAIPDARLHIVPRAGHLAPLEAPVPVTRAMRDWLNKTK